MLVIQDFLFFFEKKKPCIIFAIMQGFALPIITYQVQTKIQLIHR